MYLDQFETGGVEAIFYLFSPPLLGFCLFYFFKWLEYIKRIILIFSVVFLSVRDRVLLVVALELQYMCVTNHCLLLLTFPHQMKSSDPFSMRAIHLPNFEISLRIKFFCFNHQTWFFKFMSIHMMLSKNEWILVELGEEWRVNVIKIYCRHVWNSQWTNKNILIFQVVPSFLITKGGFHFGFKNFFRSDFSSRWLLALLTVIYQQII